MVRENKMKSHKITNNFLNEEECFYFIDYFNSNRNLIKGNHITEIENDPKFKEILVNVIKLIKETYAGSDPIFAETWIAENKENSSMGVHSDFSDEYQFAYTAILYLNEDYEGGELYFPSINLEIAPKSGDIIMFIPKDPDTEHGVKGIRKGTRYAMPIWFN